MVLMHHPVGLLGLTTLHSTHIQHHYFLTASMLSINYYWLRLARLVPANIGKIVSVYLSTLPSPCVIGFKCSVEEM
jgi:hypothetical protein